MSQLFEAFEAEETGRAFDRVDGAKNLPEQLGVLRTLLEISEAALHPVQTFLAFDQELACQFVHSSSIEVIRSSFDFSALPHSMRRPAPRGAARRTAHRSDMGWMRGDLGGEMS